MENLRAFGLSLAALLAGTTLARAETITVATVNNDSMIVMQSLSQTWEKATGNKINWIILEENTLRQRVTTDIATHGGQFDVITIGAYEAPIWGKRDWLTKLDDFGADYDYDDLLVPIRNGLSVNGSLYAAPFYGESSFTMYRKDLFDAAGLTMPDKPTWDQIGQFADKLGDKTKEQYGVCLRGKPGWGENISLITTMVNTFGGRWFDMKWQPQLTTEPWEKAVGFYVDLVRRDGPPGATANGYNENLSLFVSGHCAIWVDATSSAGRMYNKSISKVADVVAFTQGPTEVTPRGANLFWAWSLAIPSTTTKGETAKAFVKWATSKDYIKLVGDTQGWVAAPPGTRKSTYDNPAYQKAAPFAPMVLQAILGADPYKATMDPVPYTGVQFVAIPEFQGIGTNVGQDIAAALSGQKSVSDALGEGQRATERTMKQAGYIK